MSPDEQEHIEQFSLIQIYEHAIECYPDECCGLVYGNLVRECKNIQNELHAKDSVKYPRDASCGYTFLFDDLVFLNRNLVGDNPVRIIYHSHPDVGAYFSEEDHGRAVYNDTLIYPVDYLVIAVDKGKVSCARLFKFHNKEFIEIKKFAGYEEMIDKVS